MASERHNELDEEDIEAGAREFRARLFESLRRNLGPVVLEALDDPNVVEVMLNSDGRIWIEAFGRGMYDSGHVLLPTMSEKAISLVSSDLGGQANRETPIVEGELPLDGSRFEGIIAPIVSSPIFAIRKPASKLFTLTDYTAQGVLSSKEDPLNAKAMQARSFADECVGLTHLEVLHKAIREKKNIFVFGGTGSGKTTFANALIHGVSELTKDRIVLIEDTKEIQCKAPNSVLLRSSENVDISRLLRATLRLRPDRIIVGEVRGAEALDMLKAWNTGHPGGIATVHANSARAALYRLEQLIQESVVTVPRRLIAEAIDLVVFIQGRGLSRRIESIAELSGLAGDGDYAVKELSSTRLQAL